MVSSPNFKVKSAIRVIKRNGVSTDINVEKIHKVVIHACDEINNVSPSDIEIKSRLSFFDGITTNDIQEALIKSAASLITEETPNYQWVAGRLINYSLRKMVYGQYQPYHIKKVIKNNIKNGFYDSEILQYYTNEEWDILNNYIKHDRDNLICYAGMEQFREKYLVKNRMTGQIYETPQLVFMLISAILFRTYKEEKIAYVKECYDMLSTFDISLPTPIIAGVRTPQRQFSSCVLIDTDDSLDSINASASAIVKYVSQRAGIGLNVGKIRGINAPIRKGQATHTGIIPFLKHFQSAVKSCSQGSIRGGCVEENSWIEILDKIVIDEIEYDIAPLITHNGVEYKLADLLSKA